MSVLIPTDFRHVWAIFGPLADKNTWKGVLLELPASEKFSGLFCTCFEISVWNFAYTSSEWCHTSSLSFIPIWTLWPTLQPKIGQSHLSAYMALKIIQRPQIWYTPSNSECLDPYWFLSCLGNFWPSGGQKHSKRGVSRAASQQHMRFEFHQIQVSASEEFSGLFSKCFAISTWKLVYTPSRLYSILSSCFTIKGSLWPSSCF